MKYSIEIGKIIEGALKHDQVKVKSYTEQLVNKLRSDGEDRAADKFNKLLEAQNVSALSSMGSNNSIPVDTESRTLLADIIYPEKNNIEVILSKNNYDSVESFLLSYKNADKLISMGIEVANSVLLYGPPGCGKTKCAYLIAKELGLPLVIARLDSIISSYLGTTAKNIRMLFEYAQQMPCVLFLDEFDAIAKARDDSNELGELKRVVNSLLQNIDAMSRDSILVAATNHENLLDTAIWRRFDYKLEIELPDQDAVLKLIDIFLGNSLKLAIRDKKILSYAFKGLSGANIEEIIKKALRNAIVHDKNITKETIYEEIFKFRNIYTKYGENDKVLLKKKAIYLRECSEKAFSYSVIAEILGISKTKVATIINEEMKDNE